MVFESHETHHSSPAHTVHAISFASCVLGVDFSPTGPVPRRTLRPAWCPLFFQEPLHYTTWSVIYRLQVTWSSYDIFQIVSATVLYKFDRFWNLPSVGVAQPPFSRVTLPVYLDRVEYRRQTLLACLGLVNWDTLVKQELQTFQTSVVTIWFQFQKSEWGQVASYRLSYRRHSYSSLQLFKVELLQSNVSPEFCQTFSKMKKCQYFTIVSSIPNLRAVF